MAVQVLPDVGVIAMGKIVGFHGVVVEIEEQFLRFVALMKADVGEAVGLQEAPLIGEFRKSECADGIGFAAQQGQERTAGDAVAKGGPWLGQGSGVQAGNIQNGGAEVGDFDRAGVAVAIEVVGVTDGAGHVDGLLPVGGFLDTGMVAQHFPVIRDKKNDGIVELAVVAQQLQDFSHLFIDEGNHAAIGTPQPPQALARGRIHFGFPVSVDEIVGLIFGKQLQEPFRRIEGRVRAEETAQEKERLIAWPGQLLLQIFHHFVADADVRVQGFCKGPWFAGEFCLGREIGVRSLGLNKVAEGFKQPCHGQFITVVTVVFLGQLLAADFPNVIKAIFPHAFLHRLQVQAAATRRPPWP